MKTIDICKICIYKNILKKKGYELYHKIEELPASKLQTDISELFGKYVNLADKESKRKFNCLNKKCDRYKYLKQQRKHKYYNILYRCEERTQYDDIFYLKIKSHYTEVNNAMEDLLRRWKPDKMSLKKWRDWFRNNIKLKTEWKETGKYKYNIVTTSNEDEFMESYSKLLDEIKEPKVKVIKL